MIDLMVEEICTGNIGYYLSGKWKPDSFYQKTNIISFFGYKKEEILDKHISSFIY